MKDSYREAYPSAADTLGKLDTLDELLDDAEVKEALLEKIRFRGTVTSWRGNRGTEMISECRRRRVPCYILVTSVQMAQSPQIGILDSFNR